MEYRDPDDNARVVLMTMALCAMLAALLWAADKVMAR